MEVAIYKEYNQTSVCLLEATDEMLNDGFTVTQVATLDIPGHLTIPKVADELQHLIREYDIADSNGEFVLRYDQVTKSWFQLLDTNGQAIAVTGTISYDHDFLVVDRNSLPSHRFFEAWEINNNLLLSGKGEGSHPDWYPKGDEE